MGRHLDVGLQAAVDAEADAGLGLARQGLDVDVRRLLVVGVDDDLVDELDQFVVGRGGFQRVVIAAVVDGRASMSASSSSMVPPFRAGAIQLAEGLLELGQRRDGGRRTWSDTRKNLRHDAGAAHGLGSMHMTTRPSGDSSSGIQPCSSMNSRLSGPCSISERMRPALKGS
jgi:hypothetical protein